MPYIFLVEDDLSFGAVLKSYLYINDFEVDWIYYWKHVASTDGVTWRGPQNFILRSMILKLIG